MFLLVTHVLAFLVRGGVLLTLLFLAVDEEEKRRRLTKASETKVFFIGDSPPDNETAITYH
jgi:hypothetical protein